MIFRQLFEPVSSTYTYLLGCEDTGQAILIDATLPTWQRDLDEINRLGLKLCHTLDTHIHADHITAARKLKQETGSRIAHPAVDRLACVDVPLEEGKPFSAGSIEITPLFTPGHTDGHHTCQGRRVSSIGQEKTRNPRLGGDRTLAGFVGIMRKLDLKYPKFIDYAVPGNRECGVYPPGVPENLQQYCGQIGDSVQG